ncbi:DUF2190 family protein [Hansschlegelia zhihuaiae]|uniref:DUF2190 family protein n=1 Tax=Hansschlegelia zhihuaiae TaxID=405005 RepID=A0A4Q0MA90_9HYPH|nr:DUF2190 family protein [Hansschlegelia zhihuaiae]RXF69903.1 DUF2190 family protein [Hansschlegelia zhihuaiae]
MRNYVQKGENVTIPSPADVKSGDVIIVGGLSGVAAGDAAPGSDLDIVTVGVFDLPKVAAEGFEIGDPVYFDEASKLVTTDDANARIGVAVTVAANPSGGVHVRLG